MSSSPENLFLYKLHCFNVICMNLLLRVLSFILYQYNTFFSFFQVLFLIFFTFFQHTQKYIEKYCLPLFFFVVKPSIYQYWSAQYITVLTPPTYQPRSLHGILLPSGMRYLILGWASHLDAFSVYPIHTQLLSYAIGMTTDKPSVCPSWSSRTKDSSLQISSACDR